MSTVAARLPYAFAKRHGVLLLDAGTPGDADGSTGVALREGSEPTALLEVRRVLGRPLSVRPMKRAAFDRMLSEVYADAGLGGAGTVDALDAHGSLDSLVEDIPATADLLENQDDAPIIRLINGIIAEGARLGASDIHIEPFESTLRVRLRVDGVMREAASLPSRIAPLLVSRVKVMARLDIAEKRIPQDGRISVAMGAKALDVRVSTLPARGGERVVLRILDKDQGTLTLEQLGMPAPVGAAFARALHVPNGIVLVTGPTGSGKTTTLYSGLLRLNEIYYVIFSQAAEPENRAALREWLEANYDALQAKMAPGGSAIASAYAAGMCSTAEAEALQQRFAKRMETIEGGPLDLRQTVEGIGLCAAARSARMGQPIE